MSFLLAASVMALRTFFSSNWMSADYPMASVSGAGTALKHHGLLNARNWRDCTVLRPAPRICLSIPRCSALNDACHFLTSSLGSGFLKRFCTLSNIIAARTLRGHARGATVAPPPAARTLPRSLMNATVASSSYVHNACQVARPIHALELSWQP